MFAGDFVRVITNRPHAWNHSSVPCRCVSTMAGIKFNSIYRILHDVPMERTTSKHFEFKWASSEETLLMDECSFFSKIHANCRIRRVYFSDRLYSEDELPPEFKLYLPVSSRLTRLCKLTPLFLLLFRFKRNDRMNQGAFLFFSFALFFFSSPKTKTEIKPELDIDFYQDETLLEHHWLRHFQFLPGRCRSLWEEQFSLLIGGKWTILLKKTVRINIFKEKYGASRLRIQLSAKLDL